MRSWWDPINYAAGWMGDSLAISTEALGEMMKASQPYLLGLMYSLIVLRLIFFFQNIIIKGEGSFFAIGIEILTIYFIVFLFLNLNYFVFYLTDNFIFIATKSIGQGIDPAVFYSPDAVYNFGIESVVGPLWQTVVDASWFSFKKYTIFFSLFVYRGIVTICFLLMAFEVLFAIIELHFSLFISMLLFPLGILNGSKFILQKILPSLFGQILKVGVNAFFVGFVIQIISMAAHTHAHNLLNLNNSFILVAISLLAVLLIFKLPALISGFLTGLPGLSGASGLQNIASLAYIIKSGIGAMKQVPEKARGLKDGIANNKGAVGKTVNAIGKTANFARKVGRGVADACWGDVSGGSGSSGEPQGGVSGAQRSFQPNNSASNTQKGGK